MNHELSQKERNIILMYLRRKICEEYLYLGEVGYKREGECYLLRNLYEIWGFTAMIFHFVLFSEAKLCTE